MSSSTQLRPLLSGLIFGSSLFLSRVYLPSVITSQLRFTNFHMLLSFITASAVSAVAVAASNSLGYAKIACRKDATYGLGWKSDGNVLGGALLGVGMALTGACPGTVLVQLALGVGGVKTWEILLGCVLGGIVFVRIAPLLNSPSEASTPGSKSHQKDQVQAKYTVQDATNLSTSTTILIYELACLAMIGAASFLAPITSRSSKTLHPITGGLLIGLAQASSILLVRKTLGVSRSYEDIGQIFWRTVSPSSQADSTAKTSPFSASSIIFAIGIALGAKFTSLYNTSSSPSTTTVSSALEISAPTAVLGGFLLIFGARLAGGCTSGHGISGMATMSLSSFVTVAAMFAAGVAGTLALGGR